MKTWFLLPILVLLTGTSPGDRSAIGLAHERAIGGTKTSSNAPTLPTTLTVNGTTASAVLAYQGQDAAASTWTNKAGADLAIAGTGTAPTLGVATGSTRLTGLRAVTFAAAKYYQAAALPGALGTDDFVIEFYINPTSTGISLSNKITNSSAGQGWIFQMTSSVQGRFIFVGASGFVQLPFTINAGVWNHVICFVDRSEAGTTGLGVYVNGSSALASNISGVTGTIDGALPFTIGAGADAGSLSNHTIAVVNVWRAPNWFAGGATNTSQWATAAAARYALY